MRPADAKIRPDPISIRLTDDLKASLSDAATSSGRSVNAEIRMRLEWSFTAEGDFGSRSKADQLSRPEGRQLASGSVDPDPAEARFAALEKAVTEIQAALGLYPSVGS